MECDVRRARAEIVEGAAVAELVDNFKWEKEDSVGALAVTDVVDIAASPGALPTETGDSGI